MSITAIVSIGLSIILPVIGGYFYQSRKVDDKIEIVDTKIGTVSERTAKLEEAISTLKEDNKEVKKGIQEILLRIPKR